jgi:type 1 glutamine amidotransferase
VSHFSGTDLVVEHVERYVCPTITSNQILGGREFRFPSDHRPHLAVLIGEDEYRTNETLPEFVRKNLQCDFRLSFIHADSHQPNRFPGIDELSAADVLLISVRRRTPAAKQLEAVRQFVESGKPVVGIRTASHAFALRDQQSPPPGHAAWPEFDAQVFGGNYHGHHGNSADDDPRTKVWTLGEAGERPILRNVDWQRPHVSAAWLYKTSPLAPAARVLMMGRVEGKGPDEPVAWTFQRDDGGRSFYTSLGHPDDFQELTFRRLLTNAVYWAAGLDVPAEFPAVEQIH